MSPWGAVSRVRGPAEAGVAAGGSELSRAHARGRPLCGDWLSPEVVPARVQVGSVCPVEDCCEVGGSGLEEGAEVGNVVQGVLEAGPTVCAVELEVQRGVEGDANCLPRWRGQGSRPGLGSGWDLEWVGGPSCWAQR